MVTTNGCRFELEDEHSLYVEKLGAKIWIDVLYGNTDNYRSNVFYWNDIYGDQIPENSIIIGDTQNNGFIVYVYDGLEKGIYYWDDSYTFDCSNKDCNAYLIADDIKSLFENLKITYRKLFARIKKCKPNIEFGEDNMLYRATGSEKIQTIDAEECKDITHKCSEFKIKFEFTRQYYIETVVLQTIKRVEDGTGYVFPKGIRNFIFDTNVKNIKRRYFNVFDDSVNTSFNIIEFAEFSLERNAWDVNCSGEDIDYAIEKGDLERARKLQELHKYYVVFAYCEKAVNNFFAIEKSTNKIVAFNWTDLKIEKFADDFESFVNSFFDKDERSKQDSDKTKADDKQTMEWDFVETLESESLIDEFEQLCGYKFPTSFRECVIKNNGGTPEYDTFDTEIEEGRMFNYLFSFNRKKGGSTIWEALEACKIHLADAIASEDDEWIADSKTILERYVIFADTPFGDDIAFDKTDDSVVYISHETSEVEKIADSFEEFLDCLYAYDDDDI